MEKIIILHNKHDEKSRNFIKNNSTTSVISWYEEVPSKEYIEFTTKFNMFPSSFPCVVDTELSLIHNNSTSLADSLSFFNDYVLKENERLIDQITEEINIRFEETRYLVERHEEQLKLSVTTTISNSEYLQVLQYRQNLREINNQINYPKNVVFPVKPAFLI